MRAWQNELPIVKDDFMSANGGAAESQEDCDPKSVASECSLHETDYWRRMIANANRMAEDANYRRIIAKELS